jgi:hypothetical protein
MYLYLIALVVDLILAKLQCHHTEASLPPLPSKALCHGAKFPWDLSSAYLTYPFAIHDPTSGFKLGYHPLSINPHTSSIFVRPLRCSEIPHGTSAPCSSCQCLGAFVDVDATSPANLQLGLLSHSKLLEKLELVEERLQQERLKVCIANLYL